MTGLGDGAGGAAPARLERQGTVVTVRTAAYSLLVDTARLAEEPYAVLQDPAGRVWSALNLLSSVHTLEAQDETWLVADARVEQVADDEVHLVVVSRSTAWTSHELTLVCRPALLELSVQVEGDGRLAEVVLLGGAGTLSDLAAGEFSSSLDVASVLVPAAGEPVQLVRPAHSAGQLGIIGDAAPGRLHAVFSPPPLVFGLGRSAPTGPTTVPDGDWLGLSLRAPVAELTFTTLTYRPLDGGFTLRLAYEGHTAVRGRWRSPVLVLRPAASGWDVLTDHRRDLVEHGCAPAEGPAQAPWWSEPIFCGWGAQCARAAPALPPALTRPATPSVAIAARIQHGSHLLGATAPSLSRQDVYDTFLDRLAGADLDPGTLVIDDRWQAAYGTAEPDEQHWPDLRGWIADQHRAGRRVLLWWKAWDPTGLPPQECVLDPGGRPVAADPANPRYRERLAATVAHLLGPDGLDADGFKVDFTQRAPSGATVRGHEGPWGIALLHLLLQTLHTAAHQAKPDALVVCHTMHPGFGDVADMVRLNDVSREDVTGASVPVVDQLRMRHAIATRALPGHLVDTDQWPMPDRAEWRRYVDAQAELGVPALYYLEAMDGTREPIDADDLAAVAASWRRYRQERRP